MTEEQPTAELISAAFDGERVDLDALRDAVSTKDGRVVLASLLLLRAAMAADATEPAAGFRSRSASEVEARWSFFGLSSPGRLAAAACVATLLAVTSFWAGASWRPREEAGLSVHRTVESPAPVTLVPQSEARPQVVDEGAPPPVSRVLRFTPGVDWHPAS